MSGNTLRVEDEFEEIGTRTIDERKRLTLGDLIKDFRRVRLYRNEQGDLFLKPVVEVPASEAWLYQDKQALRSVVRGLKDAADRRISKLNLEDL